MICIYVYSIFYIILSESVRRAVLCAVLPILPGDHDGRELLSSSGSSHGADDAQTQAASQEQH